MADRPLPTGLTARLRRLCVLAGLALALLPPLLYHAISRAQMGEVASHRAHVLARPIARLAAQQPELWRYNLAKVLRATAGQRDVAGLGEVRVTDCAGSDLLTGAAERLGTGVAGGPRRWAPAVAFGRIAAWVAVRVDDSRQRRNLAFIAGGSTVMGLLLAIYLYLLPMRAVRNQAAELERLLGRLAGAERRLSEANIELQERVQAAIAETRALSERVLSIQESERHRIAGDLHDGLGQQLTALRLTVERAQRGESDRLDDALRLCDEILTALRHVVYDLRPLELTSDQVADVLRDTAERFELRTGIATSFRHEGPPLRSQSLATGLLRVLQEALTNAARHGQASEVGVRLLVDDERLVLVVHDDGLGFEPGLDPAGVGLRSMRERLDYLGGRLVINSGPDRGTTLRAEVAVGSHRVKVEEQS